MKHTPRHRISWSFETGVYCWFSLALFVPTLPRPWIIPAILFSVAVAAGIAYHLYAVRRNLRAHASVLAGFAASQGWALHTVKPGGALGYIGSLGRFYWNEAIRVLASVAHDDWEYREVACTVMPWVPGGSRYRLATVYYSLFVIKVDNAAMPEVFLLSNPIRPRMHKIHFSKIKQLLLPGSINQYFKAYNPSAADWDYEPLARPHVAQALTAAAQYDVELKAGRLYIYGALDEPAVQIPDMHAKAVAIRDALLLQA